MSDHFSDAIEAAQQLTAARARKGRHPVGAAIPLHGLCRELLFDFGPSASVAVPGADGVDIRTLADLMPYPFKATERGLE